MDRNGNGQWDGCDVDKCIGSFGNPGDLPVTGNWSGNGVTNVGTFTPSTGSWRIDSNGDSLLDCAVDTCGDSFGEAGDFPVTRELGDANGSIVGIFTPQSLTTDKRQRKIIERGRWNFDVNGNSTFDGCEVDECTTFRTLGELPVVGDWDGTGPERIGVFRPSTGMWYLDINGNGKMDSCTVDACLGPFGQSGDLPVTGKW